MMGNRSVWALVAAPICRVESRSGLVTGDEDLVRCLKMFAKDTEYNEELLTFCLSCLESQSIVDMLIFTTTPL